MCSAVCLSILTMRSHKIAKLNQEKRARQAAAKQLRTSEWKKHTERVRKIKKLLSWNKMHKALNEELMTFVLQDKVSFTNLDRSLSSSISIEIEATITHKAHRKNSAKKVITKTRKKRSHVALNENNMKIVMQKIEVLQTSKRRRRNWRSLNVKRSVKRQRHAHLTDWEKKDY